MGDVVEQVLEKFIPALEDLQEKCIFSPVGNIPARSLPGTMTHLEHIPSRACSAPTEERHCIHHG